MLNAPDRSILPTTPGAVTPGSHGLGTPLAEADRSEATSADAMEPQASQTPSSQPRAARERWPQDSLALAEQLHRTLAIPDRDWHALKRQRPRRAAEQIAAALVQLLARDEPAQSGPTAGREQAIALLEHGLAWLKAEISDPGCPSHGR